jgi:SAM-dependent methyltransferase
LHKIVSTYITKGYGILHMAYLDFVSKLHKKTARDYIARVVEDNKADCATVAKKWGAEYWDGDRKYGYGGYSYDGRWRVVADEFVAHYDLRPGDRILDVGCGKSFLLFEFTRSVRGIDVSGIDVSEYGLENAKAEVRDFLELANANALPYDDQSFDFVYSVNVLHNLKIQDLFKSLKEIGRVGRDGRAHVTVESYRNEREKANLLYWQLTCESFYSPSEWEWIFEQSGYLGDYGCIYFE